MAQGMKIKPGKNPGVIFDTSTKGKPHEVVLNEYTHTKFEANIDFGHAKMNLLQRIYNLRISFLQKIIYLALTNITACFWFPKVHADLTGAFGFMAKHLYYLATSMVFGSNALTSSWEPLRRAIQAMIPILSMRDNLIFKHKVLLDMLVWSNADIPVTTLGKRSPLIPLYEQYHYMCKEQWENLWYNGKVSKRKMVIWLIWIWWYMNRNKYRIGRQGKYDPKQTYYVYCSVIKFNFGNLPCSLNKLKKNWNKTMIVHRR